MINYDEIARDLYALGSWAMMSILIAALAVMRNTELLLEVFVALAVAFVLSGLFNPDDRIVRLVIGLTALGLLAGTVRGVVIVVAIGIIAMYMSARYLDKPDVWRSAIIGGLIQGIAFVFISFA